MAASLERAVEVSESLAEIKSRVQALSSPSHTPILVAVSKYKPASDILTCYEDGHLDFGENYVQELVDKAQALPAKIRWHFIGTLQSNKAKTLAGEWLRLLVSKPTPLTNIITAIPNLHTIQTLTSAKTAQALNKALPEERPAPLNILIQINTSGEDAKSGLPPLTPSSTDATSSELFQLVKTVVLECPRLHLQGLMTIGSLEQSLGASETEENKDFETLKETRDVLQGLLTTELKETSWGQDGRLLLSMGMSSDFEAALKAGSDIVRVGTGIFGQRAKKTTG
ncbi:hypothetical protein H0H92_013168 [Tricholoma furcatifolium]|nr:hypothetical protein H0H92_013168 [Tricholoma furcatifolium]